MIIRIINPHMFATIWKLLTIGGSRDFCWFPSVIVSIPLQQIQVRELDVWLAASRWPSGPISTGHVDEIAGHIMLLADSSLITALLSIPNYTGCLAEHEGRWSSSWSSLYWQYSHRAALLHLLKQPFSSQPGHRCPELHRISFELFNQRLFYSWDGKWAQLISINHLAGKIKQQ